MIWSRQRTSSTRSETTHQPDAVNSTHRYNIEHVSRYEYSSTVRHSVMTLCLKPRADTWQKLLRFGITTNPVAPVSAVEDCFGNTVHVMNIHREHGSLEIVVQSTVETERPAPLPRTLSTGSWSEIRSWRNSFELWDFTQPSAMARPSPSLAAFVDRLGLSQGSDPLESLLRLSDAVHRSFHYVPGSTDAASPIEHILESGEGVCQDYAHVMIAIARSWGVPARYVSGYVLVRPGTDGLRPEAATHAWVECMLPSLGWVGFDPTNGKVVDERYVRIGIGRDYEDVSPTRGVLKGVAASTLHVAVRMEPVAVVTPSYSQLR